ncbi:striatin isoform X1 [Gadus macrocephalus]|uniref:striatin isoform X1 n=1 Tax=Gadus macrocephalus TaxID=80720 RepID=UPI0028CB5820|nr:striatin isoform X1 [Gadus macrocephalus]
MDEQAGPGVFLSSCGKVPQQDEAAVGGEAARARYNVPEILRYMQHEWARFELERARWDVERAELQTQVSLLQGERRGQQNLRRDMLRRIKMLEYTLSRERTQHQGLGPGPLQCHVRTPTYDSDEEEPPPSPPTTAHQLNWSQGRELLTQYLQEVGCTGVLQEVGSQRLRDLLGLGPPDPDHRVLPGLGPPDQVLREKHHPDMISMADIIAVLEESVSDEDEEEEQTKLTSELDSRSSTPTSTTSDLSDDADMEGALREFDFLNRPAALGGSVEDASQWVDEGRGPGGGAWQVDQRIISQLKEEYRKERRGRKGMNRPNRSKLQDMLAHLVDPDDGVLPPSSTPPLPDLGPPGVPELEDTHPGEVGLVLGGSSEVLAFDQGLADLTNEALSPTYQTAPSGETLLKTWKHKVTLRGHLDALHGLTFHPVEPLLLSAAADHTLKLWNLHKTTPTKKCAALDLEPIYTFRAHSGAVLSVTMSSTGEQIFSGGVDGTIHSWNTPSLNTDPYDPYEPSVHQGALCGHSDAVWGLVYCAPHRRLLSCSADGTLRLWDASATSSPALATFNQRGELGVPSSLDVVGSEPDHMVTSFSTGHIGLFNLETQQLVLKMDSHATSDTPCRINRVLSHPTVPITITAQEDRHIQFFDNNTGKVIHSMLAHLDAVTCLAVDPNGLYLLSGSHDCSVRLWTMETRTCLQEFSAHRKKFHESIHAVAFHPTQCYIASAGADALAKVFV